MLYFLSIFLFHRDVKPHNVFVSRRGNCRLGDYGFVRYLTAEAADLNNGPGTLDYCAPEVSSLRV